MVSLAMPMMRRLAARRNSVSSTATVSGKASAKTSSASSLPSQVRQLAWDFAKYPSVNVPYLVWRSSYRFPSGICIIQTMGVRAKSIPVKISVIQSPRRLLSELTEQISLQFDHRQKWVGHSVGAQCSPPVRRPEYSIISTPSNPNFMQNPHHNVNID